MDDPFEILLELVEGGRLDPWEVEIGRVMDPWLGRLGEMDLRTCGRGILSASTLLRLKSGDFDGNGNGHALFPEDEEIPELPDLGPLAVVKYSPRRIQLEELLSALREALSEAGVQRLSPKRRPQPTPEILPLSDFERNIGVLMESLYARLLRLRGNPRFSELLEERGRVAAVRLFVLLLYLAFEGKVLLTQEGPEVRVEVRRDGV
jgi:segregation and condensation protein A